MYVAAPMLGFGAVAINAKEREKIQKENDSRLKKHAEALKKHDKEVALYKAKLAEWEERVQKLSAEYAAAQKRYEAAYAGVSAGNASATAQYNAALSRWNALKVAYDQALAERSRIISSGRGQMASASAQTLARWSLPAPPGFNGSCITAAQRTAFQNECAFTNLRGLGDASRSACGYQELPVCPPDPPMPAALPGKPAPPKLSALPRKPAPPKLPARPKAPGAAPPPPKLLTVPREEFAPPPPKPPLRQGDPKPPPEASPPVIYEEPSEGGGNFAVLGLLGLVAVGTAGYLIFRKKRPAAA